MPAVIKENQARKFKVEFSLDNAAFDGAERDQETARSLEKVAKLVSIKKWEEGPIFDSNGNRVGSFGFEE